MGSHGQPLRMRLASYLAGALALWTDTLPLFSSKISASMTRRMTRTQGLKGESDVRVPILLLQITELIHELSQDVFNDLDFIDSDLTCRPPPSRLPVSHLADCEQVDCLPHHAFRSDSDLPPVTQ
ncbi:hypothetical protein BDV11DRAFT_191234, partial [Aspergillus similis]